MVVSKNTADVHCSGHMGAAAAGPGPHLALPWHPGTADKHLDPLVCLALETRGREDQRPFVRNKGKDYSMGLAGCVPGGYPSNNQDSDWLPRSGVRPGCPWPNPIPVSWLLNLVKHQPIYGLAELAPVLVVGGQVEVGLVPLQLLVSVGRDIARGKTCQVRSSAKFIQFSCVQPREMSLVGIKTVHHHDVDRERLKVWLEFFTPSILRIYLTKYGIKDFFISSQFNITVWNKYFK
jgi:hypothetical protein